MAGTLPNLEDFRVQNLPSSIYYIPNFITPEEEEFLLNQVNAAPKPKWTQLSNRRLQNWGGLPHPKGMVPEKIPEWLDRYCRKIGHLGAFGGKTPNHVLVNEYLAGQGIMPHTDGPLYYPTVSTISLGSHTLLDFYTPIQDDPQPAENGDSADQVRLSAALEDRYIGSMLLERRSLILVREDMYSSMLHGIQELTTDKITDKVANIDCVEGVKVGDILTRDTRVSLTIRVVPKVLKAKLFMGGKR